MEKEGKDVSVMWVPVCMKDRRCCLANKDCLGELRYYPDRNKYVFNRCGC